VSTINGTAEVCASSSRDRISHVPEEGFKRPETANELFDLASVGVNILYAASEHIYQSNSDLDHAAFYVLCGLHRQICEAHDWIFAAKWISERRMAA
jgi:hypothetical protein